MDKLEVVGSLVDKSENENSQFQRDLTVSSSPTDYAKLSALFSQKGLNDWDDVTRGVALELTPAPHTRLGAGYRYTDAGSQALRVRDYSLCTKPWSFFSASGILRDRDLEQAGAPDTASISVSLAPARYFTLTGDYQSNPEDNKGLVQYYKATNVGLTARIGSVGLSTAFTEKDEYQIVRPRQAQHRLQDRALLWGMRGDGPYLLARIPAVRRLRFQPVADGILHPLDAG